MGAQLGGSLNRPFSKLKSFLQTLSSSQISLPLFRRMKGTRLHKAVQSFDTALREIKAKSTHWNTLTFNDFFVPYGRFALIVIIIFPLKRNEYMCTTAATTLKDSLL